MKKVLFIVPSKAIGGTNSSLSSIINQLTANCEISVLLMCSKGTGQYDFLNKSFTDYTLDIFYSNHSELRGIRKLSSFIIKMLKRISIFLHIPLETILYKYIANKYQKMNSYDIVVGFAEGKAMKLASAFNCAVKYTWIHCEYDRAVPKSKDEFSYYNKFDKIICVSKFTMGAFVMRYPLLQNKTIYIYNLLDIERIYTLSNANIDDDRFEKGKFIIISVGRMHPVKRFPNIPKIAKELLKRNMEFVWYIIGGPCNEE